MRRPELTVTVDPDASASAHTAIYELTQSPSRKSAESARSSLNTLKADAKPKELSPVSPDLESPVSTSRNGPSPVYSPPAPSLRALFSSLSRRDALTFLLPAAIASMIAGGVAPFMTLVVGNVFDAFAQFPVSGATAADAARLRKDIGIAAIELVALGIGAAALGSVTSALWIATGERNVRRVRERVYRTVMSREMGWFDTAMGDEDTTAEGASECNAGAGGLMAKFNRDTDDVRAASALAAGMLLQYLTTCLACLGLAFARSWALTLVILSALPVLIVVQGFSQVKAGRHVAAERGAIAKCADLISRALDAIRTVKAFNAQESELKTFSGAVDELKRAGERAIRVWAFASGAGQATSMAMFVQGFWFGAKLVRDGTTSAGQVMAVFWACLIAASNLQMCVPQLVTLARGKFAAAALVAMIDAPMTLTTTSEMNENVDAAGAETDAEAKLRLSQSSQATLIPLTPPKVRTRKVSTKSQDLRKITPSRCTGELALHDVSFAYPAHPTRLALDCVSLYFPAGETTFVVGRSGSGKSTVGALLAGLYPPSRGSRVLDEQDAAFLDPAFLRAHIALVPQRTTLFAGTVHENVALAGGPRGVAPEDVSRAQVEDACRAALVHEFVRDLPNGYDTFLGEGGAQLSGGQRQRIAIARALLKRPTVLILDEATSALDGPSRSLVHAALRARRRNMSTIVITHDLSQIDPGDFVYVMQGGSVVEQGFRADLERPLPSLPTYAFAVGDEEDAQEMEREASVQRWGAFARMLRGDESSEDNATPDEQEQESEDAPWEAGIYDDDVDMNEADTGNAGIGLSAIAHRNSALAGLIGGAVQEIARTRSLRRLTLGSVATSERHARHGSYEPSFSLPLPAVAATTSTSEAPTNRRLAKHASLRPVRTDARTLVRRLSLQFTPMSPAFEKEEPEPAVEDDEEFEQEKSAIERSGAAANLRRAARGHVQRRRPTALDGVVIDSQKNSDDTNAPAMQQRSLLTLLRAVWPTVPGKPLVFFGLVLCILSGAMTPAFAFVLSRLLFLVSSGAQDVRAVNIFGGVVLALAATDGLLMGAKYFVMETRAGAWVAALRRRAYSRVLAQDTAFFDGPQGESVRVAQTLVKDAEDARNLIAVCIGQSVAVAAMLGVGLIWALVQGWQLTLAGLAIAPVFAGVMAVQARLVANAERRNKTAREEVAKAYYESLSNIRAIRAMALERAFDSRFAESVASAQTTGMRGALVEGCSFGVANGLIYLAEALLFFVGAELVASGTYTYLRMVEVLNLVVFTVTIGAQLMAFTQKIAKASNATWDLNMLVNLSLDTDEARGAELPPAGPGRLEFKNVRFAYPARPDVPVLRGVSLSLSPGECVAVVGSSGSGKSTLVQLVQRFYEPCLPSSPGAPSAPGSEKYTPAAGTVSLDGADLRSLSVGALRARLAVVSQAPHLFDASVAENIAYGDASIPAAEVERAAREAHAHEFVEQLAGGYAARCGSGGALLSGGQAQRVAIARALAARGADTGSKLMLLDECTSALDPNGAAEVLDAVRGATRGRTTLLVTHKLTEMRLCDRIVVMEDGRVAEEGRFEELVARNGVFARLARGGEWVSD